MSTPTKPLSIRGRPIQPQDGHSGASGSLTGTSTPLGTPDMRALRVQYTGTPPPNSLVIPPRNIPGRTASPVAASDVSLPSVSGSASGPQASMGGIAGLRGRSTGTPSPPEDRNVTPLPPDADDLPEEEKIKVLRRHLVSTEERQRNNEDPQASSSSSTHHPHESTEPFPVHYDVPGADVTHDIYKWQSNQKKRIRAASVAVPSTSTPDPAFEHIHEPGGFRRNYVLLRANEEGADEPQVLNNFIDFLFLFGHFAGEDLEEDEEEQETDLESADRMVIEGVVDETAPLLGGKASLARSRSRSRRRASSMGPHGNATVGQAVLMLLKAFIGTGVLFLGRAFYNGGILFSALLFLFIAAISLYSFILLVHTKFVVSGSFGDIGGALYGNWMRQLILGSIVVSQMGFCGAYMIFVAENMQSFVMGVTHCARLIGVQYFLIMQLVFFLPLVLIRDLAKLSTIALVADVFILAGLIYIFGSEFKIIANRGIAEVALFNPKDFPLFVGTAVFSFEGIGLVIPLTDAMKEPHKFPAVISGVMAGLVVLFGGAGVLAYLTFGSDIKTVVLVNLDTSSPMVQAVQFLYSVAIMLSVPLQLFPAVRIMENGLFVRSGKIDVKVKWLKNFFRFLVVIVMTLISYIGAADLDKFVAFVGCFACVPLCYVYPAMLHYKACAHTRSAKLKDIAMMVFGMLAAIYTTIQTLRVRDVMFIQSAKCEGLTGRCPTVDI
ncbi:transmembrane amino acid transporter protein-domain-containing protein [Desarmillaria ectypa]|nr:transmembrane amino acid transporter protein-domain-containing protein [Desarmillaria ectypa]